MVHWYSIVSPFRASEALRQSVGSSSRSKNWVPLWFLWLMRCWWWRRQIVSLKGANDAAKVKGNRSLRLLLLVCISSPPLPNPTTFRINEIEKKRKKMKKKKELNQTKIWCTTIIGYHHSRRRSLAYPKSCYTPSLNDLLFRNWIDVVVVVVVVVFIYITHEWIFGAFFLFQKAQRKPLVSSQQTDTTATQ